MTIYVCPFAFEERINNVSAMVWTATWDPMRSHENEEIQHDGKGSIWPRDAGHTMIRLGFSAPGSYLKDLILWSSGVKWIHWSSAIRKMTWIGDRTLQIIHTQKKHPPTRGLSQHTLPSEPYTMSAWLRKSKGQPPMMSWCKCPHWITTSFSNLP